LTPHGGATRRSEMCIQLKHFLVSDWENLREEFFLQAQALVASSNLVSFPQHNPLIHIHLFRNLLFRCTWEYVKVTHALEPFSPTPMSFDTTLALIALHLNLDGYFPLFLKYYKLNQKFKLFLIFFKLAFQHMPHLLASGFSKMIF